jgi:hypothetical protein
VFKWLRNTEVPRIYFIEAEIIKFTRSEFRKLFIIKGTNILYSAIPE